MQSDLGKALSGPSRKTVTSKQVNQGDCIKDFWLVFDGFLMTATVTELGP